MFSESKIFVTLTEFTYSIDKQMQRNDIPSDKVIIAVTY